MVATTGTPDRHGLEGREPEALVERRIGEDRRAGEQGGALSASSTQPSRTTRSPWTVAATASSKAGRPHPSGPATTSRRSGSRAAATRVEGPHQGGEVLAGLDGAQGEHVALGAGQAAAVSRVAAGHGGTPWWTAPTRSGCTPSRSTTSSATKPRACGSTLPAAGPAAARSGYWRVSDVASSGTARASGRARSRPSPPAGRRGDEVGAVGDVDRARPPLHDGPVDPTPQGAQQPRSHGPGGRRDARREPLAQPAPAPPGEGVGRQLEVGPARQAVEGTGDEGRDPRAGPEQRRAVECYPKAQCQTSGRSAPLP